MSIREQVSRFAERNQSAPPARLGQRFTRSEFLPEAGNTVVCHLDVEDPRHTRILDARSKMMALPGAQQFLMTPETSLHMTVFEGVIETRRTADGWPKDIDRSAPVDAVTASFLKRLADFSAPEAFKLRVAGLYPMGIVLEGATDRDKAALLKWRDAFADRFDFRHEGHETYRHHMTLGYATGWLSDDQVGAWQAGLDAILEELADGVFTVPLKAPAFCTFADMTHFEERLVLS